MAETELEVRNFCRDTLSSQLCSIDELKTKVSTHYDVYISGSDNKFIEAIFTETILRFWEEESEESFIETLKRAENTKSMIQKLFDELSSDKFNCDNAQNFMMTPSYKIIKENSNLFKYEDLNRIYESLIFKAKLKIKEKVEIRVESEFIDCLLKVIRNSDLNYHELVKDLQLEDFIKANIKLEKVFDLILTKQFKIKFYDELKVFASRHVGNSNYDSTFIRTEIRPFVLMERREFVEGGRKTLILKKKIIFMSDVDKIYQNIRDVRVVCDIFHGVKNKKSVFKFKVDNFIIIANEIKIHDRITIDLSGDDAKVDSDLPKNAGRDANNCGVNGRDGNAGESGGNIGIFCENVINGHLLTLKSNGGNGSDGQNGGDGVDGKDGRNVEQCNLSLNGEQFKIKNQAFFMVLSASMLFIPEIIVSIASTKKSWKQGSLDSTDNFYKVVCRYSGGFRNYGFMLAQGDDGTPGTNGGLCGLGGDGGNAGIIQIHSSVDGGYAIKEVNVKGVDGKDGIGGLNGIHGKDGRDAWAYDSHMRSSTTYFGLDSNNKYEVVEEKEYSDYAVWSKESNVYRVVRPKELTKASTSQLLNNIIGNILRSIQSKASHAQAETKNCTFNRNTKKQYSEFLNNVNSESVFRIQLSNIELNTTKSKHGEKIQIICQKPVNDCIKHEIQIEKPSFDKIVEKMQQPNYDSKELIELIKKCTLNINQLNELKPSSIEANKLFVQCFEDHAINLQTFIQEIIQLKTLSERFADFKHKNEFQRNFPTPKETVKLIPYLSDTKSFQRSEIDRQFLNLEVNIADIHFYFNDDSEMNRNQIKTLFIKITNLFLGKESNVKVYRDFLASIVKVLFRYKSEFDNLTEALENYEGKFNENSGDFKVVMKEILSNKKVVEFIEKNLLEEGIRSPIYKEIISQLFQVSFRVFMRNIDGTICLCEEFEFESTKLEKLNLLMHENVFTELEFNLNLYSLDKHRRLFVIELFKNINESEFPIKKILDASADLENIIKKILSHYPSNSHDKLESALKLLKIEAKSVLLSIGVRLFYEENIMTVQEFSTLIFIMLEMISKDVLVVNYLSYKLLMFEHSQWIVEIILLCIENHLNQPLLKERNEWRQNLSSVSYHPILVLFLTKIEKFQEHEMNLEDFNRVIRNMKHFSQANYDSLLSFEDLKCWQKIITSEYWLKKFSILAVEESTVINELQSKFGPENLDKLLVIIQSKLENRKNLNILAFLQNFNTGEWIFSNELFEILKQTNPKDWTEKVNKTYSSEEERSVEQITKLIRENNDTSESIKDSLHEIESCAKKFLNLERNNLSEIRLRNTQAISALTLLLSKSGALIQVGTGEGKTFIGVAFAAIKISQGEKVHIVTSSSVLAERDATDPDIVRFFKDLGFKVGHNCHEDNDRRRQVYMECQLVYGTLGNFQRDYLLTNIYDLNILPEKCLQNILADEVDSILLDKGNNILYLSKELPNVDELEFAFTFIWNWINQATVNEEDLDLFLKPENIRQCFLDNFIGVVDESDIKKMSKVEFNSQNIMNILKKEEIININGCVMVKSFTPHDKIFDSLNLSPELNSKLVFYLENKIKSPKVIKIPEFYHSFVMRYLDRWIKSALNAMVMQEGVQYVIDKVSCNSTNESEPNIVILDVDTGTDQKNSEWDEGLCQFLQLKHGCRLSQLNLKSVFISNVSYFKLYKMKYGMTGTLGSKDERDKLNKFYDLDYATIPSYLPKKFVELEPIVAKSFNEWFRQIVNDVKSKFEANRSVLVICNTIKDIQTVENAFRTNKYFKQLKIHVYKRDYEKFIFDLLTPRQLIIATNLAGRGTDIRLSDELAKNGGLHVVLTYLAPNVRVENQAYGRAARAGAKGSARLIIMNQSNSQTIKDLKFKRDQDETVRLEKNSSFYKNFTTVEENFFQRFLKAYKIYSQELKKKFNDLNLRNILLENVKVMWSLWLDEHTEILKVGAKSKSEIEESFEKFIKRTTKVDYFDVDLHPITRVHLSKYFANSNDFMRAQKIVESRDLKDTHAFDYNLLYIKLSKHSIQENFNHFKLNELEIKLARKTIQKFQQYKSKKSTQAWIVKIFKRKYQVTLVPVEGFENQIEENNEINQIFIDNSNKILGSGITPESFKCNPFGNSILNEEFHKFLIDKNFITNLTVDKLIEWSKVEEIAQKYQVDFIKLKSLIEEFKSTSLDDFGNKLKNSLNFQSREAFWSSLVKDEILVNEVHYAIIDLVTISGFLPFVEKKCINFLKKHKIQRLKTQNDLDLFFFNFEDDNEKINKSQAMAIKLTDEIRNDEFFKQLVDLKVVNFNKKATLTSFKDMKFEDFDSITKEDFNFIKLSEVREKIIQKLIKDEILTIKGENLLLNNENFYDVDFEENFVYKSKVLEVIATKFKFHIALKKLERDFEENKNFQNIFINLPMNPQLEMIHDLINNFVIIKSEVNLKELNKLESDSIFNPYMTRSYVENLLKNGFFDENLKLPEYPYYGELVDELLRGRVLYELGKNPKNAESMGVWNHIVEHYSQMAYSFSSIDNFFDSLNKNIVIYDTSIINLSDRFKNIEESVKLILDRKQMFVANKEVIIKTLRDAAPMFEEESLDNLQPVLKPLEEFITKPTPTIECMKLKGLDSVITTKRYFKWYYYVIAFAFLAVYVSGLVYSLGFVITSAATWGTKALTIGGIQMSLAEIFHVVCALKNGTFSWKDQLIRDLHIISVEFRAIYNVISIFKSFISEKYKKFRGTYIEKQKVGDKNENESTEISSWKNKKRDIMKTSLRATAQVQIAENIEQNVAEAFDYLIVALKNSLHQVIYECKNHQVFTSIGQLSKSELYIQTLAISEYKNLTQERDYLKTVVDILKDKVDVIINSELEKFNEPKNVANSLFASIKSVVNFSVNKLLDDLNQRIVNSKILTETESSDRELGIKILSQIALELNELLQDKFNREIRVPGLNMAAKKSVTSVSEIFANQIKQEVKKQKGKNDAVKNTIAKNLREENLKHQEVNSVDEELEEIIRKKVAKIKSLTKNVKIITNLSDLEYSMSFAELEAAAIVCDRKFEIYFENRVHSFGKENSEILKINLASFKMLNKLPIITYDELFKYLRNKINFGSMAMIEFKLKVVDSTEKVENIQNKNQIYFGFYGLRKNFKLSTKKGSEKFKNFTENIKLKNFRSTKKFDFNPNQDLREFDSKENPKNVKNHQAFNQFRAKAVHKTLEKINELLALLSSTQPLTLEDFFLETVVEVKSKDVNLIYFPVLISHSKKKLDVLIYFDVKIEVDELWIPFVGATLFYEKLEKSITFETLIPSMSNQSENECIPSSSTDLKCNKDLHQGDLYVDFRKIFNEKYSHIELVTINCKSKLENLPSKNNFDFVSEINSY